MQRSLHARKGAKQNSLLICVKFGYSPRFQAQKTAVVAGVLGLGQLYKGAFPAQLAIKSLAGWEGVYRVAAPVAHNARAEARGAFLDGVEQGSVVGIFGFGQVSQIP